MDNREQQKRDFINNYTGIYNPGQYFEHLQQVKQNKKDFGGATHSTEGNRAMLKEANEKSFNRHMRKKLK